jgi:V8-like Glu-specific endopeptidase
MKLAEIRKAIADATAGTLNPLDDLDRALEDNLDWWHRYKTIHEFVAVGSPYPSQIDALLTRAEALGWLPDLSSALVQAFPRNAGLRKVLLETAQSVATEHVEVGELEAMLGGVTLDFAALESRKQAVCRVEYSNRDHPGEGTGFLVGEHAILTNWHVAKAALDQPALEPTLRFRFGYYSEGSNVSMYRPKAANGGASIKAWSKAGGLEMQRGAPEPGQDYLDYAIIEVEPVEGNSWSPQPVDLNRVADHPQESAPLMAIQHPAGGTMQFALGQAQGYTKTLARLKHSIPTQYGSSGSLIVDATLKPLALHNGRRTSAAQREDHHNTGVPLDLIVESLRRLGAGALAGLS